jgi:hypothetical protein
MSTSDFNLSGDIFCDRRQRRLFGQALAFVQVSHHIGELEDSGDSQGYCESAWRGQLHWSA